MRMNATNGRLRAWAPAVPCKIPDNIVSSKYTTAKVFVPSYEKELPTIERLLANDYQRIWLQEKQVWNKILATKMRTKKILPRTLIKRKVPTCVTVKYQTRAEQLKEKKKKCSRQNNPLEKSKAEEMTCAKQDKAKLEKSKKNNPATHEETKSEICEETRSRETDETRSEISEKTEVKKHEEMGSGKHEEIQSSNEEELKSTEQREETKSERSEKGGLMKQSEETESEKDEETQSKKSEELKSNDGDKTESEKSKEGHAKLEEEKK